MPTDLEAEGRCLGENALLPETPNNEFRVVAANRVDFLHTECDATLGAFVVRVRVSKGVPPWT